MRNRIVSHNTPRYLDDVIRGRSPLFERDAKSAEEPESDHCITVLVGLGSHHIPWASRCASYVWVLAKWFLWSS